MINLIHKLYSHTKTVLMHKYEVYKCMKDCGYAWRGIWHDMSKFSPVEFFESIKYYQGYRSPIEAAKEDKGYSLAWFHHRGRNPHHSQYWCDMSFGEVKPCTMPWKYFVEFLCDGVGASKTYAKNSGIEWKPSSMLEYYNSKDSKSFYSDEMRNKIVFYYTQIAEFGWERVAEYIKKYGDYYSIPRV